MSSCDIASKNRGTCLIVCPPKMFQSTCPIFCFSELTKNVLKHMSDLCVSQSAPKNASVILSELNKSAKGEGKGRCLLDMCFSGLGKREKKADVCLACASQILQRRGRQMAGYDGKVIFVFMKG